MKTEEFNEIVCDQINRCLETLECKASDYATKEDRLHTFKVAAELQGVTKEKALAGMMAKHIVSIFDMCGKSDTHKYSQDIWNEKIGDAINYLLILRAIVNRKILSAEDLLEEKNRVIRDNNIFETSPVTTDASHVHPHKCDHASLIGEDIKF